jgi:hypothetical protein
MAGERKPAVHQLNFVKTANEVANINLTDFVDKYASFMLVRWNMIIMEIYLYNDLGNG